MAGFTVAVVQAASVVFDREACLEKVAQLAGEARAGDARLALLQEAFVPGYPRGMSVDVPAPAVDRLAQIAAENELYLVEPVVERDGGTLCCTTLFFSPEEYLASTAS